MSVLENYLPSEAPPPSPPKPWTTPRILGNALMLFWITGAVFLIWYLYSEWAIDKINQYGPKYWSGLKTTLGLVAVSIVLGAILSVPLAFGRMSKNPLISRLSFAYVYFFRGTPLLAQLFLIYYGFGTFRSALETVGLWTIFRDAWNCAVFAFALNTAAYQAEILRGAIESVTKGQWEGAAALGLSKWQTFQKVIFPQAMIVALRPYGNEIILMIKGSAIVALVTVYDLMGETRRAYSRTYDFQTYVWAAIFYLSIVEALRNLIEFVERRLTKHLLR
jgi:polar amino acid transport system permease protein